MSAGLLDLNGPWFWALYTLAGMGFTSWSLPHALNAAAPLERDLMKARPAAKVLLSIVLWAVWPLSAAILLASVAWWGLTWLYEHRPGPRR